jgi:hypothetical protein
MELSDEIERRRLKFADLVTGQYEMLPDDEHDLIVHLLREYEEEQRPPPTAEERAEFQTLLQKTAAQMAGTALENNALLSILKKKKA